MGVGGENPLVLHQHERTRGSGGGVLARDHFGSIGGFHDGVTSPYMTGKEDSTAPQSIGSVNRSLGEDAQDVVCPGNNDYVSEGNRGLLGKVFGVEERELLYVTRILGQGDLLP